MSDDFQTAPCAASQLRPAVKPLVGNDRCNATEVVAILNVVNPCIKAWDKKDTHRLRPHVRLRMFNSN